MSLRGYPSTGSITAEAHAAAAEGSTAAAGRGRDPQGTGEKLQRRPEHDFKVGPVTPGRRFAVIVRRRLKWLRSTGWGFCGWLATTMVLFSDPRLLSVLALLVSVATCYFSFFWHPQAFRVFLRFPAPLEVGMTTLSLDYFFSNMGNQATLIADVSLIELWINSEHPEIGGGELHSCRDAAPFGPSFRELLPPDVRREHIQMKSGNNFSAVQPTKVYIDGIVGETSSATVEAGKIKIIATRIRNRTGAS